MEIIPKLVGERLKTPSPAIHPDPDLLAAFAEHSLHGRERTQLLEHLATCADCRQVISLAQPLSQAAAGPVIRKLSWYSYPALRWSTAAALVLLAGGAVMLRQQRALAPARSVAQIGSPQVASDRLSNSYELPAPPQTQQAKKLSELQKQPVAFPKPALPDKKTRSKQLGRQEIFVFKAPSTNETGAQLASAGTPPPASPTKPGQSAPPSADIPSVSEKVEVMAAAPVISATTAQVSKAKEPATDKRADALGGLAAQRKNGAAGAGMALSMRAYSNLQESPIPRWTLSTDGGLQRSFDSGKTWEKVTVEQGAVFRAVSAVGPEVWTGGKAGLLYHSSDSGGHWTRIKPVSGDIVLSGDIATIEFIDAQHGKLTTTNGQVWMTSDIGQTWQTR